LTPISQINLIRGVEERWQRASRREDEAALVKWRGGGPWAKCALEHEPFSFVQSQNDDEAYLPEGS
jgi:hypothetical protein